MILTTTQARTVYAAMCELNNIGAKLQTQITVAGPVTQIIHVQEHQRGTVVVNVWPTGTQERYDDQAEFAAAYGLDETPQRDITLPTIELHTMPTIKPNHTALLRAMQASNIYAAYATRADTAHLIVADNMRQALDHANKTMPTVHRIEFFGPGYLLTCAGA